METGLYEQVLNKNLKDQLSQESDKTPDYENIDKEEAPKVLAQYLAEIIEQELLQVKGKEGEKLQHQINLANNIIREIGKDNYTVESSAKQLISLEDIKNNMSAIDKKSKKQTIRPITSISQSSLFTGAHHEPTLVSELQKEILTSDRIDMLVSFIKWSGVRLMIEELKTFTQKGGKLRVITTSYMGATDVKAIVELNKLLDTEIKISYDTQRTRLHAKAYIFYRNTGFTTAYVGSSNISNAAMTSGLEWNVKITAKDQIETINKISGTFESYLNSPDFITYTEAEQSNLEEALKEERSQGIANIGLFRFDVKPYPYQQEILDKIEAEREVLGQFRNLVVAATGTGKTVIAAFDYKRFCEQNKGRLNSFLFVAHRKEILEQSIACFRAVLNDANFGELLVGQHLAANISHLFVSIQTFNSKEFTEITEKNYYDYIIIDEFHHGAAATYQKLLNHYEPKILLGLTATPERMDGKSILPYFNNRIAAEIRLPEAIDRKLLTPFQYFGITDEVDLKDTKWSRGGYDSKSLSNIYTGNDIRLASIIKAVLKYVTKIEDVKGLGFCVSQDHAKYMSNGFNQQGIKSIFLTAESTNEERTNAKQRLEDGDIKFIFIVDLYNEGVDIPSVNTVLFLRPTESLTVFLQQLGRGLRLAKEKECLTVLDFIGQANQKYSFNEKFLALLEQSNKGLEKEIENGFISVPRGCYIKLEKKAQEYVLNNIKQALNSKQGIVSRIASFREDTDKELNLENFLDHYKMNIRDIYKGAYSFSRLMVLAKEKEDFTEELEDKFNKVFSKVAYIDSRRWITFLLKALPNIECLEFTKKEQKMLTMLQYTFFNEKEISEVGESNIEQLKELKKNPVLFGELLEILRYNYSKIDFIDQRINLEFDCPLDVYCTYSRDQILVAMDFLKPSSVREGIKFLKDKNIDLLFVTLNKSEKEYSPSTMYNDYSINERLFHWQSQNKTSPQSETGQRYINHKKEGSLVLLFVREYNKNKGVTAPYTFLGGCDFVKNEGSKPMNITWRLHKEIPAKYLKSTNQLVIG